MRRIVPCMILTLLLVATLTLAFNVGLVRAQTETVYINSDGSVSPSSAPISSVDNVTYTFTGSITYPTYDGVVVERGNIVIDGNGYTLQGNQSLTGDNQPDLSLTNQGLSLTSINNVTIKNANIKGFQDGIYLKSSNDTTISGNNVAGNSVDGIYLEGSSNDTISLNNATANGYDGIVLCYSSNSNVVSNNNSTANGDDGISLTDYSPFHVFNYGVSYPSPSSNTVSGNNATANSYYGIWLQSSSNNTVSGNNSTANTYDGISLYSSNSNVVSSNNSTANSVGIDLYSSSNNIVSGNNVTANSQKGLQFSAGIYIIYSSGNVLSDNVMEDNEYNFDVFGDASSDFMNSVDTSNLVDGKPVYYMSNKSNLVISPENYPNIGYLGVVTCTNMTVQGLTLTNEGQGILLAGTNNSKVTNNNVTNNGDGISLFYSSNNTVSGNNATANSAGIDLWDSSNNNTVSGNNATGNGWGIGVNPCSDNSVSGNNVTANREGIVISGSYNIVSGNNVAANSLDGIFFLESEANNVVSGNNITANREGIDLWESSGNIIYHNNFVGNGQQVLSDGYSNVWDDGYPSGGNYWSDYNGTDLHSGPFQNEPGSDGIGDTPYVIDATNTDRYPLMTQYVAVHDVAVPNVTSSKTVVGQGFSTSINITVVNEGDYSENFTVTTSLILPPPHTLAVVIDTTTVSLDAGNNATINLAWNTTDYDIGNYTIAVTAGPVPGETSTADNTFSVVVKVTIPGDLNGDFKVNSTDLALLQNAYGSKPGDFNWNPNADINSDGKVSLSDLVILARHYGEQYSTQEQVRDAVMAYIGASHPETAQFMQNLNWTGGSTTPEGIVGAETYSYTSDGWNVTMQYPVVPNAIYSITAKYATLGPPAHSTVTWQGTWQNGTITETNYNFAP